MDPLSIHLFGGLEIHAGASLLPAFRTVKSKSLFAFLVLNRDRLIHRDVLCGHFWGDQPDAEARKALRTALWRIRSVLEPNPGDRGRVIRVEGHGIGFPGTREVWVDVTEFDECVAEASGTGNGTLEADDEHRLVRATSLYRGDLAEGHYEEWCLVERERLRLEYLTAVERLVAHYVAGGEWLDAISRGREVLRHDPLREHIHRILMTCHAAMGDRPSAIQQYRSCARILDEELGIGPMEETTRLYERIREGGAGPDERGPAAAGSGGLGGRPSPGNRPRPTRRADLAFSPSSTRPGGGSAGGGYVDGTYLFALRPVVSLKRKRVNR